MPFEAFHLLLEMLLLTGRLGGALTVETILARPSFTFLFARLILSHSALSPSPPSHTSCIGEEVKQDVIGLM